jgi:DNA-binding NtrC family response regulator
MRRILLIDDDNQVRASIELALRARGFDVVSAPNAAAGLRVFRDGPFDLAIVDIFMPGMDGLETIQKVHQQQPELPVVVMSGMIFRSASSPPPDFLAMAEKLGAVRSLRKPFRPHELLKIVEDSLNLSSNGAATTFPQQVAARNGKDGA